MAVVLEPVGWHLILHYLLQHFGHDMATCKDYINDIAFVRGFCHCWLAVIAVASCFRISHLFRRSRMFFHLTSCRSGIFISISILVFLSSPSCSHFSLLLYHGVHSVWPWRRNWQYGAWWRLNLWYLRLTALFCCAMDQVVWRQPPMSDVSPMLLECDVDEIRDVHVGRMRDTAVGSCNKW